MSIIQGHAKSSGVTGFYDFPLEQSLRFNDDDSAYLSYVASSGSRTKFTISCWAKLAVGSTFTIFGGGDYDPDGAFRFFVSSSGRLNVEDYDTPAGTYNIRWSMPSTGPLLRDPSAWYHIVLSVDTTPATPAIDIYVNGEDWGSYWTKNNSPSQGDTFHVNIDGKNQYIGYSSLGTLYADGYLAEVNFIDGTAYDADSFGELKNGVWIPKDPSGLTYGTNGFRLSFADDAEVEAFNTVLFTGSNQPASYTGFGFKPDLLWTKDRDGIGHHHLFDAVRGAGQRLRTSGTFAEDASGIDSFDSDGFTENSGSVFVNGNAHVAWGWKAGGAPTVDNSAGAGNVPTAGSVKIDGVNSTSALAGTIPATRLSASTTYGFSIVSYTGTGANATIGHGLGATPDWIIVKNRDRSANWTVWHKELNQNQILELNTSAAVQTDNIFWNNTLPTSTVFSVAGPGDNSTNASGEDLIAYCWAEKAEYSKFGSYSGSASNQTISSLGFKPALVVVKRTDTDPGDSYWVICDNTRQTELDAFGFPLLNGGDANASAEQTSTDRGIALGDNDFTVGTDRTVNTSGGTYIYAAFADTREAAFWLDQSGNDNDWQPVNLDHNDTVADSPTDNFATWNPLDKASGATLSDGNLLWTDTDSWASIRATIGVSSGQWYWECTGTSGSNFRLFVGIADASVSLAANTNLGDHDGAFTYYSATGAKYSAGIGGGSGGTSYGDTFTAGDVIGVALDMDAGTLAFYKNNSPQGTAFTGLSGTYFPAITSETSGCYVNFGQQPFKYDPPE